jgi:glycosyltransferase involved in cell wall biosynthesis
LTSTHEGFPTVFYEALINNTVVICTIFDGFSDELIKKNINALVCKRKGKYFIKCFQRIIDEPQLLDFFVRNNENILSNYEKIAVIDQWFSLLK